MSIYSSLSSDLSSFLLFFPSLLSKTILLYLKLNIAKLLYRGIGKQFLKFTLLLKTFFPPFVSGYTKKWEINLYKGNIFSHYFLAKS